MLKSKSISAGVILVALTFLVACQEEPMPKEVTLSVNTVAMYDALGISHDVAVRVSDGQIECLTMHAVDVIRAKGYNSWILDFIPFNPEHLTQLE